MKVWAPASTSNLGPGFDILGAALSVGIELELTSGHGWTFHHQGPGAPVHPPDGDLVMRAFRAAAGADPNGRLVMRSSMPVGAGLGSSGAAVAAGLVLGDAVSATGRSPEELVALGVDLEGHADNVAASLFGGLVVCVPVEGRWHITRHEPTPSVRPTIVLCGEELATSTARGALPEQIDHHAAVRNAARLAGLLDVLTGRCDGSLVDLTIDELHEPFRRSLMPRTAAAQAQLRQAGIAAVVSGAGPSLLCLGDGDIPAAVQALDGWEILAVEWDLVGTRVIGEK